METGRIDIHNQWRSNDRDHGQRGHHRGQTAKHPADQDLDFGMRATGFIFGQYRNKRL